MYTDYKIKSIVQNDDGTSTVIIRVSEGDITAQTESDFTNGNIGTASVTRYRRTSIIREASRTFTAATFALRTSTLNGILATDHTRTPIPQET